MRTDEERQTNRLGFVVAEGFGAFGDTGNSRFLVA